MKSWAMWAVVLGASLAARADTVKGLSGNVDGFGGMGSLQAQSNASPAGSYTIEQISGPGVTGLMQPTSFFGNQNQLFPGATPVLDGNGFAFTDTMDGVDYKVNIFSNSNGSYGFDVSGSDGTDIENAPGSFSLIDSPSQVARLQNALFQANSSGTQGLETFSFRFSTTTQAASPTPEPGSFALMGTGLLGAAAVLRRRARR